MFMIWGNIYIYIYIFMHMSMIWGKIYTGRQKKNYSLMFCSISLHLQLLLVHSGYFEYRNFSEGFWKAELLREDTIV